MPYKSIQKRRDWYNRWYARNGRNRAVDYLEAIQEWVEKHPDAVMSHRKLRSAIKHKIVIKPERCTNCGKKTRLSGHHDDYSKPLGVVWLCSSCHKLRHPHPLDKCNAKG